MVSKLFFVFKVLYPAVFCYFDKSLSKIGMIFGFLSSVKNGEGCRCFVGPCDNYKKYPEKLVKNDNFKELKRYCNLVNNEEKRYGLLNKGRSEFTPSDNSSIFSDHFLDRNQKKVTHIQHFDCHILTQRKANLGHKERKL